MISNMQWDGDIDDLLHILDKIYSRESPGPPQQSPDAPKESPNHLFHNSGTGTLTISDTRSTNIASTACSGTSGTGTSTPAAEAPRSPRLFFLFLFLLSRWEEGAAESWTSSAAASSASLLFLFFFFFPLGELEEDLLLHTPLRSFLLLSLEQRLRQEVLSSWCSLLHYDDGRGGRALSAGKPRTPVPPAAPEPAGRCAPRGPRARKRWLLWSPSWSKGSTVWLDPTDRRLSRTRSSTIF